MERIKAIANVSHCLPACCTLRSPRSLSAVSHSGAPERAGDVWAEEGCGADRPASACPTLQLLPHPPNSRQLENSKLLRRSADRFGWSRQTSCNFASLQLSNNKSLALQTSAILSYIL